MIKSFRFSKLPLIIFGRGKVRELPALISHFGSRVLLVSGRHLSGDAFSGFSLAEAVQGEGKTEMERLIVSGEPSDRLIDDAVSLYRKDPPDLIVSVGGGSVLDAGKAVSAMLTVEGSVKDYLEGVGSGSHPGTKIPFIAVPTTSGTGSEATKNSVISGTGEGGFKKSLRHDNFVSDIALVDPELTISCPPEVTAASGMDCFTQLTEAYLSTGSNEYTDALATEGLKAVKSSLLRAYRNGKDSDARTGMAFAALTSGICLANAGLGVVHGFASAAGAMYDIPHGLICGTLMAASNEMTVSRLREKSGSQPFLGKYASLARLFLDDAGGKSDDRLIDEFIEYLYELTAELSLPGLRQAGIGEDGLEKIALNTESKNNPVKLETGDLTAILQKRFV
ncbi:MAG: iron-containing alcohol dehydrogenase [Bacteroidales bacterium]|nr:iron-containing alcohol dehydrogenase [Bacteroidales bacterium]